MGEPINNREHRIAILKRIIKQLHADGNDDEARGQLRDLVRQTDASEIAAMEQQLMAEGMPVEEVMAMCDQHAAVVRDIMVERSPREVEAGHPVDTFRRENQALQKVIHHLSAAFNKLAHSGDRLSLMLCRKHLTELRQIELHYSRKENLLFPFLEQHGITGPSKVMWAKDDEVRDGLNTLAEAFGQNDVSGQEWNKFGETVLKPTLAAVEEMFRKEQDILLPMALDTLTAAQWGEIWEQSAQIGFCLIKPGETYQPPQKRHAMDGHGLPQTVSMMITAAPAERPSVESDSVGRSTTGSVRFASGTMSHEVLGALFDILPVDVAFVDAEDRVRYFSEGGGRIFVRQRAVLGRRVQDCHPPASVHVVEQILSDFRTGREDSCSFWINFHGRFIYIRYFALRNEGREYLGTLEVTQDVTDIRQLEGERRLLEYETGPSGDSGSGGTGLDEDHP